MTGFLIGGLLLLALAWWLLRGDWSRPSASAAVAVPAGPAQAALAVLREQLAGLPAGPAQDELRRRVLDEGQAAATLHDPRRGARSLRGITVLGLPLAAAALYVTLGNPAALVLAPAAVAMVAQPTAAADDTLAPAALSAMLDSLAQSLQTPSADPVADAQGWAMLGRGYASMQRFADADAALARAVALAPDDAQLLADRADVLAVVQGERTDGEPERLVARALQIDPRNVKALALAGTAAYQRQDLAAARIHWQQARDLAPAGSAFQAGLERSLAQIGAGTNAAATTTAAITASATASITASTTASTTATVPARAVTTTAAPVNTPTSSTDGARLTGRVSLAPALAGRVAPTDTVFVFARPAGGPRMPLAVVRATVAQLPLDFVLDDGSAMSAQARLSGSPQVIVGARISRSGNATPQPGDLETLSAPRPNTGSGVQLVIDTVLP